MFYAQVPTFYEKQSSTIIESTLFINDNMDVNLANDDDEYVRSKINRHQTVLTIVRPYPNNFHEILRRPPTVVGSIISLMEVCVPYCFTETNSACS